LVEDPKQAVQAELQLEQVFVVDEAKVPIGQSAARRHELLVE
jgi:hypothetical protein